MKLTVFTAVAVAITMSAACGGGDGTRESPLSVGTSGEGAPRGVERFAHDVVAGNTAEIELGRMAQRKAANPEVKQFAEMMVRDHTAGREGFKQLLSQHNMPVEETLDEKHRDLSEELGQLNGAAFDHRYVEAMVEGHQQMEDLLEGRANETPNNGPLENAVNQWAAKTLPTVKKHLKMAQQVEDRLDNSPRPNTTQ
jgi:putative membrane protein